MSNTVLVKTVCGQLGIYYFAEAAWEREVLSRSGWQEEL